MKSKLLVLILVAGGSLVAQTRFSASIGGYAPGYYSAPRGYYAPDRAHVLYRSPGWGGAGYWGESPERQHERAEQYGLHNHQQGERYINGDSPELWEHHAQEQRELRHEQWHERSGDLDAGEGAAHGSARDGYYRQR